MHHARRSTVCFATLGSLLPTLGLADALPAYSVGSGTPVSPGTGAGTADAWYCAQPGGCTASGTRQLWATDYPKEIVALAKALRGDVDVIYEYVRNNIEVVPVYGLHKGALGAIIDRSGSPFDQAQLMVELLRASNPSHTASYVWGSITLTGPQASAWLGTDNAAALTKIFADGGIPATVTPATGTASSVTLSHIWVQVNIGGTNYVFDPSYKPHAYSPGMDVAAHSGWNTSNYLSAIQSTMQTGTQAATSDGGQPVNVPYVSNLNVSSSKAYLTARANQLVDYLRANGYASKQLEDVIGRQDITPMSVTPVRATTLSYGTALRTWTQHIPDVYRTKVTLEMVALNGGAQLLIQTLFADEIYGRRVFYDTFVTGSSWTNFSVQLRVDGAYVGSQFVGTDRPDGRAERVKLSIDHPYAANSGAYMDQTGANALVKKVDFVSPVFIVLGLGEVSDRLQAKFGSEQVKDELLPESTYFQCGPSGCENPDRPAQPAGETGLARASAGWLAQYSRMAMIQTRLRAAVHQHHHTLGVAYRRSLVSVTDPNASPSTACSSCWSAGQGATVIDVDTSVSVNSKTDSASDRQTLARALAASADTLEASQFEQLSNTATPASVAYRFNWGTTTTPGSRYFVMTPATISAGLFPTGGFPFFNSSIHSGLQQYTNAGYKLIVAENQFLGPGGDCAGTKPCSDPQSVFYLERGGAYQAFSPDYLKTASMVTDARAWHYKGGSAGSPPSYQEDFNAEKSRDLLKDQFKDRSRDFGIDLATGEFTYSTSQELSIGLGEFPYQLAFERTFRSGESHSPGMGKGWSHNLDIRMQLSSSGAEALGQSSPLGAAATLVALLATQEVYSVVPGTDTALLQRWIAAPFIQAWWAEGIRFNVATYTAGSSTKVFVRLPDGTFNPPGGWKPAAGDSTSYWKLTQTGQPTLGTSGGAKWDFSPVSFTLESPSKDVQSFAFYKRRNRDIARPYHYGLHHGWHITTWTFPQGVSLSFTYVPEDLVNFPDDHLQYVQSSLGRRLNFAFTTSTDWDKCNIQSINDNQGHTLGFDCVNNTVTSPAADQMRYVYGALNCGLGTWSDRSIRPRCSPYLHEIFGPSDTAYPKIRMTYDETHRVEQYFDAVAIKTPANRDPYRFYVTGGTRGERKDPAGHDYTVYYDSFSRAIQFIDELGHASRAEYNGLGQVVKRFSAENILTEFEYDLRGNVKLLKTTPHATTPATVPAVIQVSAQYHPACGKIWQVTDAKGAQTDWTYNTTTCLASQVQQPLVLNGVTGTNARPTTLYTYTSVGLLDTLTDPSGVVVDYDYDGSGNRTRRRVNPAGINQQTSYGHDTVGNITSVTTGRGNTTTYLYDEARRLERITGPAATCTITENIWQGGLVTKVRNAKICSPNFGSDANWQVWLKTYTPTDKIDVETDPEGGTVDTDYDALDRTEYVRQWISSTEPHRVTRTEYDAAGQVLKIHKAWGTPDPIQYVEYAYTPDGRVDTVRDGNLNETDYKYDGYGRLYQTVFPPAGTCSTPCFEQHLYDANGNVERKRNRSGEEIVFAYDALNREFTRTVPDNAAYAGNYARTLTTTYDLASRKWDVTADGQTLRHRYDTAGRLRLVEDSILNTLGGSAGNVEYTYDASSNRATVLFRSAQSAWQAMYGYDAGERLHTITDGTNTLATLIYDPLARFDLVSFHDGSSADYAYEADGDIDAITHAFSGGSLVLNYAHNGAHQLTGITSNIHEFLAPQLSLAGTYVANSLNQYTQVAGTTYTHDANGNLTSDGVWSYAYDEENRLRRASKSGMTVDYAYDALGRRRSKSANGTLTYYVHDGANELAELSSTGVRQRFYVNGDEMDARIAWHEDGGAQPGWRFYHVNYQGSVVMTTRPGVAGYEGLRYGGFGESADASTGNPIRYTGRYFDAETSLYNYRARYYSPQLGRFLQTDPVGYKDDLNLYAYVANNPINFRDDTGESKKWVGWAVRISGEKLKVLGKVTKEQAVRLRRQGENFLGRSHQKSREVEVAAHGEKNLMHHKPHVEGYRPHYQTEGMPGHSFYAAAGAAVIAAADALTNTAEAAEQVGGVLEENSELISTVADAMSPLTATKEISQQEVARALERVRAESASPGSDTPTKPEKVFCTGSHIARERC